MTRNVTDDASNANKTAPIIADRIPIIDSETNPDSLKEVELSNLLKFVSGLNAVTPALADIVPILQGGTPRYSTVQNLRSGYVLSATHAAFSPADATTYYFGSLFTRAPSTSAVVAPVLIPRAGTITAIQLWAKVLTTPPSNEQSTVSFRLSNTTDTTITSTLDLSGTAASVLASVSIPVTTSDYFEIKWVTPSWATNPNDVILHAWAYVS